MSIKYSEFDNSIVIFDYSGSSTFPLKNPYQDSFKGTQFDMVISKFKLTEIDSSRSTNTSGNQSSTDIIDGSIVNFDLPSIFVGLFCLLL